MSLREDQTWQALLAAGAPAFAGETAPPYGLATRIIATARQERHQREASERIGWRAIFASCAMVALTAAFTVGWHFAVGGEDPDPAVRSMALVENVPVS